MKPPVCDSPFDVAFWLLHHATDDGEYLQPQKLQRLMYLAQAYYGVASKGQKLMPCVFVTTALGPVEPSTWRAFEHGPPNVDFQPIPQTQRHFLDSVWRRFGSHSVDYLTRTTVSHPPYQEALELGKRAEISFDSMISYYGRRPTEQAETTELPPLEDRDAAPSLDNVVRPQVMRSHKGRPVSVKRWAPTKAAPQPPVGKGGGESGGSSS